MKYIDQYIEASGADCHIKQEFNSLTAKVPLLSKNLSSAGIQVKEFILNLFGEKIAYDRHNFTIQAVLKNKSGNCLGLPLLIASVLNEKGFSPSLALLTSPHDATYQFEQDFVRKISEDMPYSTPELAVKKVDLPMFRFAPLQHLVVCLDDFLLETTCKEHQAPESECLKKISFSAALSFVYKDRALNEISRGERRKAAELVQAGTVLWQNNSQLYSLMASLAKDEFDDAKYKIAVSKFNESAENSSVDCFDKFLFTGNSALLEQVLSSYPSHAAAIASKADLIVGRDAREARFLFAIASQCYANSTELNLSDFYINFCNSLCALYGKDSIKSALENSKDYWGSFAYHFTMFTLKKSKRHFGEAKESAVSPRQQFLLLDASKNTKYFDTAEFNSLTAKFNIPKTPPTLYK